MSFSAKKFLQQYGVAGVVAYGGVTLASVTSVSDLTEPVDEVKHPTDKIFLLKHWNFF